MSSSSQNTDNVTYTSHRSINFTILLSHSQVPGRVLPHRLRTTRPRISSVCLHLSSMARQPPRNLRRAMKAQMTPPPTPLALLEVHRLPQTQDRIRSRARTLMVTLRSPASTHSAFNLRQKVFAMAHLILTGDRLINIVLAGGVAIGGRPNLPEGHAGLGDKVIGKRRR